MKSDQEDWLGERSFLDQTREWSLEGLQPPEIVGQVEKPTLEAIRRLWWRALDRLCYCVGLIRLSISDRISGPSHSDPPT
jgi:hypothetical protein